MNASDGLIVVEIPSRSATVHFRAYSEPVGNGSLLDWAVRRLSRAFSEKTDVCVLAEPGEAERVERTFVGGSGVRVWRASGGGTLHDLNALARTTGRARVLLVDVTAALLPSELLQHSLRHHLANRHQATSLVGLPCAAAPVLIDAALLSALACGSGLSQVLPRDIRSALAALERAAQASGKRVRVRLGRLAPVSAQAQAERSWPYAVRLADPDDVAVLRRVLDHCSASSAHGGNEPLDCWIDTARESRGARFACVQHRINKTCNERSARRVLYVQNPSAFSGVEQVLVLLAEGIATEFAPPFEPAALIASAGTLTDQLAAAGVDVRVAHRDFAESALEHYLYSRRILNELRPNLIHAHTFAGLPVRCAAAELGVPFVQHVHVANEAAVWALRDQITSAAVVIAISDFVKRRVIRLGVDPENIHVIRNGVRLPAADEPRSWTGDGAVRVRARQACGISEGALVVLLPARFAANKRHDVALEAFTRLHERVRGAHLLLAGEAYAEDQAVLQVIENRIDRIRLRDRVHRLGFWRDMPALYAASDVMLLPSEDDPLPLTVLEAMAAGVPVVAARSGGTPEMIEHDVSGLLVEPGDADGFAAALAEVLDDRERRDSLIAGGWARCRAEFSLSRFVDQVGRLYEQVLASEPVAAGGV